MNWMLKWFFWQNSFLAFSSALKDQLSIVDCQLLILYAHTTLDGGNGSMDCHKQSYSRRTVNGFGVDASEPAYKEGTDVRMQIMTSYAST